MGVSANVDAVFEFEHITGQILDGALRGENLAAEALLALAIPVTPKRDGVLRASGQAVHATDVEEGAAVTFDTPYAARLHEHPEYKFNEPGTGGKYLENPAMENRQMLLDIIRKAAADG